MSVYDFSTHGLDLATVWKLDVRTAPLRQVHLSLDGGLQLVSARPGRSRRSLQGRAGWRRRQNRSHAHAHGTAHRFRSAIRLAAIGPLVLDTTRPLPRIRTHDIDWQEGTCTLLVREPLFARRLQTHDCRQTKYAACRIRTAEIRSNCSCSASQPSFSLTCRDKLARPNCRQVCPSSLAIERRKPSSLPRGKCQAVVGPP